MIECVAADLTIVATERNHVKGKTYLSFRIGQGPRIRLPDDPRSEAFQDAYRAALLGQMPPETAQASAGFGDDRCVDCLLHEKPSLPRPASDDQKRVRIAHRGASHRPWPSRCCRSNRGENRSRNPCAV